MGDNTQSNVQQQQLILLGRIATALESIAESLTYTSKSMSLDGKLLVDVSGLVNTKAQL